jgi:pimeloyl-ACP methyl ester carboxylesterase
MYLQAYEGGPMETTHEIRLSSGTIRYRDAGVGGANSDAPVLVFVHGFMVDGLLWRKVVSQASGWARCISPDLPLGSHTIAMDDDADLSPRGVAALLAEFLEALDVRDVTVIGNDTGGAITQLLVTTRPERIGRLVLTSCDAFENFPPKLFRPLMKAARGPRSVKAVLSGLSSPTMRKAPFAYGWTAKHGIPDDITEQWVTPALTDAGVRRDISKLAKTIDPADTLDAATKLARFDRPTLIVWGEEDKFFPLDHGRRLAAIIPEARLETVADTYAFIPEDQPDRLTELLRDFVAAPQRETEAPTSA